MGLFAALGLVCGLVIGWQLGWRVGAREMADRILCITARLGDDDGSFDAEARKYCTRIGTPISRLSAKAVSK